ncbi:MAG: right-handed parallel beta-helix repeat-containing protein, partial [Candidatus Desulfofervidaceae bacterium]|nr:right-handed parallel beta-helix repeat-containing protein [Candidatus Desulfofervidaceae bacterium]
ERNGESGALLDNAFWDDGLGAYIGTGTVTITSSKSAGFLEGNYFNNNGHYGLNIKSRKTVTVNNADAADNGWQGLSVDNSEGTSSVSVGVTAYSWQNWMGNNGFEGINILSGGTVSISRTSAGENGNAGIFVDAKGTIKLKEVAANGNTTWGAWLTNLTAARAKSVSLTDCEFDDNHNGAGVKIFSRGSVTAKGLRANRNTEDGVHIDTTAGSGKVTITYSKNTFESTFDQNGYAGISIESFGSVSVNGVSAWNNGRSGIWVFNPASRASVTVKNTRKDGFESNFGNNTWAGIYVRTLGTITLQKVNASNNGLTGADLDNCIEGAPGVCAGFGSIHIKAAKNVHNEFSVNTEFGILARSHGSINLTNVYVDDNGLDGAYLRNDYDGALGSVKIKRYSSYLENSFVNNGWNAGYTGQYDAFDELNGLTVYSNGSILLQYAGAHNNGNNCGALLRNDGSPYVRKITVQYSNFSGNGQDGLAAYARGSISLKNIGADNNGWAGAYLQNNALGGIGNITLTTSSKHRNWFNDNNQGFNAPAAGLVAASNGIISIKNVDAYNNLGTANGITLDNSTALTSKKVSATNINSGENGGDGLNILATGPVTVSGIDADNNGWDGLFISNIGFQGKVTVTTNSAHKNNWLHSNANGLFIESDGSVYMQNIDALSNGWDGIFVDNTSGTGYVTYKSTRKSNWLSDNGWSGMWIGSNGTVSVTSTRYKIVANGNGAGLASSGIDINNSTAPLPRNVTLKNIVGGGNVQYGIKVLSKGNVSATSIAAMDNGIDGFMIDNRSGMGTVALKGTNVFENNTEWGLWVDSNGAVTLYKITAVGNHIGGVMADTLSANIKFTYGTVRSNWLEGIRLNTAGNISLYYVRSFSNGHAANGDGALLFSSGVVTLKYSAFQNNWGSGVHIWHPNGSYWPTLYKTSFFGNDVDGSGDGNIEIN